MSEPNLLPAPSFIIGPTWQRLATGGFWLPEKSLGNEIVNWMYQYLIQPTGPRAGEPLLVTPEQYRFLLWWYAVDPHSGRFIYRNGLLRRLKGWGKDPLAAAMSLAELCGPVAFSHWDIHGKPVGKRKPAAWVQVAAVSQDQPLSLDTEVPTPSGWVTVGDLKVGDYVFGSDGLPHRVERETDILTNLDCYKVIFDDGTSVIASASHGWTTERLNGHGDRYEQVTQTTEELSSTVRGSKNRKRHRIPVVGVEHPTKDLLVDPWFLGLWLRDGTTKDSSVVFDWNLKSEYEVLLKDVVEDFQEVVWAQVQDNWGTFRIKNSDRTNDISSMRSQLRQIGVLGNKHIPFDYMTASREQRFELLRGLVDSDGGIDVNGRVYFVNTNTALVGQFQELVSGLGFRCTVRKHESGLRAEFNPGNEVLCSKLEYKYTRQKPYSRGNRSQHRWIESVEKVESQPVKCIGIDTEDHLFQVTRSHILTHNTRNTFTLFPAMASKKMREEYDMEIHKTRVDAFEGACFIEAVTSSPLSLEGKRPTFVIKNETQWWVEANSGLMMSNVIAGNVTKGAYGVCRSLSICNAHRPGEESDAERDYDAYLAVQAGEAVDNGFLYDALEAPPDTPVGEIADLLEDEEAYQEALSRLRRGLMIARGDAEWLDVDIILESILDVRNDVTESRRKFLNQINAAEDAWISPREWDKAYVPGLRPLEHGDRITLGFDGSKSQDWTALVACRVEDAGIFPIKIWDPEKYGGEVPREDVNDTVEWAMSTFDVVGMRADVREFEAYVDQWGAKFGKKMKVRATQKHPIAYDMRSNIKSFTLDCERFQDAVYELEICHTGSPVIKRHINNAVRRPNNFGISISKATKDSGRKIDAAVCAVLAFGARQEFLMSKNNKPKGGFILR